MGVREWSLGPSEVAACRDQFPALRQVVAGQAAVFLDGPAGTQVPQTVIDAIAEYLIRCNANHGGLFATSQASDEWLEAAHEAVADLLGASDPHTVSFGANMTTLAFAVSRALAKSWSPGDEIVVTRLDHDANVTPWVRAAEDRGVTVRYWDFEPEDCTLHLERLEPLLNGRTRLLAVGAASNATGSINPVREACQLARERGAVSFVDAVHYAPHAVLDVQRWGCDLLACSAYKFFGPHVGILWGRRELLETLPVYKVRPAPETLPGRMMTGTQNHEGIAGVKAAVDYLEQLGRVPGSAADSDQLPGTRREALERALTAIRGYERRLSGMLLERLAELPRIRVVGIADPQRLDERLPTVSITHDILPARELARRLGQRGIFVWSGNFYALQLTEQLGLEPAGMVRIGLVHYNLPEEIERLVEALKDLSQEG